MVLHEQVRGKIAILDMILLTPGWGGLGSQGFYDSTQD